MTAHKVNAPTLSRRPRIVVSDLGRGHQRVARAIGRRLRQAGVEVSYAGPAATPEETVEVALAERADAIGLSIATSAHMRLVVRTICLLRAQGGGGISVAVAGAVRAADATRLTTLGVNAVLTSGVAVENFATSVRCRPIPRTAGFAARPTGEGGAGLGP